MVVAAPIRLGCYCRFVCTPDLLTVRGISTSFPDRRKIWLDCVRLAQCDPRHRYRRRNVVFTWVTFAGVEKLRFRPLEKFESGILGGVLCLLGMLIILFER